MFAFLLASSFSSSDVTARLVPEIIPELMAGVDLSCFFFRGSPSSVGNSFFRFLDFFFAGSCVRLRSMTKRSASSSSREGLSGITSCLEYFVPQFGQSSTTSPVDSEDGGESLPSSFSFSFSLPFSFDEVIVFKPALERTQPQVEI